MDSAPTAVTARFMNNHASVFTMTPANFCAPSISKGLCIGMDDCGLINGSPGFLSLREADDGRLRTKPVEFLLLPEDYAEALDSPTTEGGETTEFGSSHDSADSCADFGIDASVVNSGRILSGSSEEDDDIFAQDVSHLPDLVDLGNTEVLDGPFASFGSEVDSSNTAISTIIGGIRKEDTVGSALMQMVQPESSASVITQQQQLPIARQRSNTGESDVFLANIAKPLRPSPPKGARDSQPAISPTAPKQLAMKRSSSSGGSLSRSAGGVSKTSTPRNRSKVQALPADASRSLALKAEAVRAATAAGMQCCRNCGTTNTPLWRGGPEGPKTLCNACGVRYMKTNKKPRERRA